MFWEDRAKVDRAAAGAIGVALPPSRDLMQWNRSRIRALTATAEALKPGLYEDETRETLGIPASADSEQEKKTAKGKGRI